MINQFQVINFKSHKNTTVNFENLTVLCGKNGVGKSSLIQSLLLLRQTDLKGRLEKVLSLNDPLCFIGKVKDAIYQFNEGVFKDEIHFQINAQEQQYSWVFDASKELDFLDIIHQKSFFNNYKQLSLFTSDFQFLSASRSSDYKSDDYEVLTQKQISINEGRGELLGHFLYEYGKKVKVNNACLHISESDSFLLNQTTAWEREISTGVNVIPKKLGDSYEIRYSFEVPNFGPTDAYSSNNVGFGLSYSLPIIVAILSAQKDALIIIENPEAHLHPNGIAKLTELICLAAKAGVQIILETHSDHIINGILVQCKKFEEDGKGISKDKVSIYHFDRDETEHCTRATKINIEEDGKIRYPPKGFFDQFTIDRKFLMGF
jgi:predicted ATPase